RSRRATRGPGPPARRHARSDRAVSYRTSGGRPRQPRPAGLPRGWTWARRRGGPGSASARVIRRAVGARRAPPAALLRDAPRVAVPDAGSVRLRAGGVAAPPACPRLLPDRAGVPTETLRRIPPDTRHGMGNRQPPPWHGARDADTCPLALAGPRLAAPLRGDDGGGRAGRLGESLMLRGTLLSSSEPSLRDELSRRLEAGLVLSDADRFGVGIDDLKACLDPHGTPAQPVAQWLVIRFLRPALPLAGNAPSQPQARFWERRLRAAGRQRARAPRPGGGGRP